MTIVRGDPSSSRSFDATSRIVSAASSSPVPEFPHTPQRSLESECERRTPPASAAPSNSESPTDAAASDLTPSSQSSSNPAHHLSR
eukprot:CAMPEP_0118904424 /NCGR_PEP_ID=MMETSP1166-20130328/8892_1 /TAXON_ID=1104430 /ORGANISM="Chrysoreinhardia sp, Strain CCMP3193" /LENGTH=85 /DNA_ID=CAMNT_0006843681 /DNA_START=42 /DNA_END=296 /DNA_ORIENTATION=+